MNRHPAVVALAVAAGAYGAYSAARCSWNLSRGQGCPKCEATGAALGLALVGLSAYVLWKG